MSPCQVSLDNNNLQSTETMKISAMPTSSKQETANKEQCSLQQRSNREDDLSDEETPRITRIKRLSCQEAIIHEDDDLTMEKIGRYINESFSYYKALVYNVYW